LLARSVNESNRLAIFLLVGHHGRQHRV